MYSNKYKELVDRMKTASELIDDHQNYQRCMREAQNFDRSRAWSCLQDMYAHYQRQISVYGALFDGTYVVRNVAPNMYSDAELIRQLVYIAKHIPSYILIREGENELGKRIGHWIDQNNMLL